MDVRFYHLTTVPLEKTLPRLLEKVLASGLRSVVLTDTQERVEALDTLLWTYTPLSFLPHGHSKEGQPSLQPIWLTTHMENPNKSKVLVVTEGSEIEASLPFETCIDIFNGLDEAALASTRQRWKTYKSKGYEVTYWRQDERGHWLKDEPTSKN